MVTNLQRHSGNLENGSELVRKALSQRLIWSWILRKRCVWRSTVVVAVVVVAVADLSLLLIAILMVSDRSCCCCLSLRPLFWCCFCWMLGGSLLGDEFKDLLHNVVQDRVLRSEVHFERDYCAPCRQTMTFVIRCCSMMRQWFRRHEAQLG